MVVTSDLQVLLVYTTKFKSDSDLIGPVGSAVMPVKCVTILSQLATKSVVCDLIIISFTHLWLMCFMRPGGAQLGSCISGGVICS